MTSEKRFAAYNALGRVADDLVMDALLPEDIAAAHMRMKKERSRRLSKFFESGWGVAIVCALVAALVMGGIIWAGNQPEGTLPPVGMTLSSAEENKPQPEPPAETDQETSQGTEQETSAETEGESQPTDAPLHPEDAVVIYGLEGNCMPPKFLCYSTTLTEGEDGLSHGETADGVGFEGLMKKAMAEEPPAVLELPTVIWAKDTDMTDFADIAEGYTVVEIKVYDMDMQLVESGKYVKGYDTEEFVNRFVTKKLSVGTWYVSLRVEHDGGEMHDCAYDYAFVAQMRLTSDTLAVVTHDCTLRTGKGKYTWGEDETFGATLTATVAGAILDIGNESWRLFNLDTDEYVNLSWVVVNYSVTVQSQGNRSLIAPKSFAEFAEYGGLLRFDWETTPPGRYRLIYVGLKLSEGEEYPYCEFEILPSETETE